MKLKAKIKQKGSERDKKKKTNAIEEVKRLPYVSELQSD